MKFTISWLEKKNNDWYVVNLKDEAGEETKEVSINRTAKNGQVFPDFDNLMSGGPVEGEPWTSGAGKNYLFAPKPEGSSKKPNMDRLMEKKSTQIAEAQSNKAQQIAQAQDRSAWMWAKTNASTLIGDSMSSANNDTIANRILDLATKIYNGEPTEPF